MWFELRLISSFFEFVIFVLDVLPHVLFEHQLNRMTYFRVVVTFVVSLLNVLQKYGHTVHGFVNLFSMLLLKHFFAVLCD